jgi:hypothetical protein
MQQANDAVAGVEQHLSNLEVAATQAGNLYNDNASAALSSAPYDTASPSSFLGNPEDLQSPSNANGLVYDSLTGAWEQPSFAASQGQPIPGYGTAAEGLGGLSVDSSGYSQGVNYAAYAPNSGNFTPPTPQYSSGNPLPVTITNTQAPQINITIPGATIVGSNGAQQLANVVQQQLITTLRQAGFKL